MTTPEGDKRRPTISFIITDYNIPENLLQECVESILAVDLPADEREIILVDDGSDTPPTATLERFGADIRYLRQDNRGLSAARNAGLAEAKGEFIQFVDGDDCLIPEVYSQIVSQLESERRRCSATADTDIFMFRLTHKERSKHSKNTGKVRFRDTTGRQFLYSKNLRASACGYVFRRKTLGDLRFEDGIYHEDELFTPILFCQAGNIKYTSAPAYYYRLRSASITNATENSHIEKRMTDFLTVITRLGGLAKDSKYEALTRRTNQLCMDYLYNAAVLTGSFSEFSRAVTNLKERLQFPLPLRCYTWKYWCFCVVTRTKAGLRLVFKCISRQ